MVKSIDWDFAFWHKRNRSDSKRILVCIIIMMPKVSVYPFFCPYSNWGQQIFPSLRTSKCAIKIPIFVTCSGPSQGIAPFWTKIWKLLVFILKKKGKKIEEFWKEKRKKIYDLWKAKLWMFQPGFLHVCWKSELFLAFQIANCVKVIKRNYKISKNFYAMWFVN